MLNVSKNKCVGCGICESDCPADCIYIEEGLAVIDEQGCMVCRVCIENCPQDAIKEIEQELLFAIGTDDDKKIKLDNHVGMSKYFQVWKYSEGELTFIEKRKNPKYEEDQAKTHGDPNKAKSVGNVLKNIDVIIGKRFGPNIKRLKNKFVCAVTRCETIKQANQMIKENINEIVEEKDKQERRGIILN